jgi:RNA polymerase sigma-70 factor (sigma-E family)
MARDLDEFTEYVAARSGALLRTAVLLVGGDRQHAEDLVQEAFAETYRRWNRISAPEYREAYTRTILVRLATRRWRRRNDLDRVVSDHGRAESTNADHADTVAVGLDIQGFLRELPERQRAVVVLRYFDNRSEAEIATLLGCAPGTVKTHAFRALKALEARLTTQGYRPSPPEKGPDR